MLDMVGDMLLIARPRRRGSGISGAHVDLSMMVREAACARARDARQRGFTLSVDVEVRPGHRGRRGAPPPRARESPRQRRPAHAARWAARDRSAQGARRGDRRVGVGSAGFPPGTASAPSSPNTRASRGRPPGRTSGSACTSADSRWSCTQAPSGSPRAPSGPYRSWSACRRARLQSRAAINDRCCGEAAPRAGGRGRTERLRARPSRASPRWLRGHA